MALDNELVVNWLTAGLTGTLNVPGNGEPFDDTKEYYNLKITVSNVNGQTAEAVYKVTNALEHLPSLCVAGNYTGDGLSGWCFACIPDFSGNGINPLMRLINITSNITFELVSKTGETSYWFDINEYGGADCVDIAYDSSAMITEASTTIQIEADFPLFMGSRDTYEDPDVLEVVRYNYDAAVQGVYMSEISLAGDDTHIDEAVNGFDEENTIPQNKIYFIKNVLKKNGSIVETKHYRFRIPPGAKIWLVKTEHDNTGQSYNMKLHMNGLGLVPTFLVMNMLTSSPSWNTAHLLTSTLSDYYWGEWTDFSNGDWYKVVGNSWAGYTNIPVFKDDVTGNKYGDGEIGDDAAENAGEGGGDGNITTGDDLDSSDVPSISIAGSGVGCNVWALSLSDLNTIANILHDDDQTLIEDIKKGTWLWGNNPIDFIISVYYVPFNVSTFYDTESSSLFFGSYDTGEDFTRVRESKSAGQRAILVDTTIDQVYGDWRDLDFFKYDLYLPYIGFVPLDPVVYVGHQFKVELAFDVMTHNIRYYLYSDGTLTDRVDGSVGYSVPLTGTDQVNKANNNLNGIINTVKGGVDTVKGVATGNIGDMASGALSTFNGVRQMMQYPREIIRGDISASMNIFDINYIYLKVTEKQSVYPPEIREVYNNPSYVCCKLSELSGYCELQDVQLKSSCTEVEYAEILQLLKEGVIF